MIGVLIVLFFFLPIAVLTTIVIVGFYRDPSRWS